MSRKILASLLLILAAAVLPVERSWADHRYIYYPAHEIYYEPASSQWFWPDGGNWRSGSGLPVYYQQYTRGGITIDLDADRPYYRHDDVVKRYGRGPRVIQRYQRPQPTVVERHYYDEPRGRKHKHKHHKRKHKHHDHDDRDD